MKQLLLKDLFLLRSYAVCLSWHLLTFLRNMLY